MLRVVEVHLPPEVTRSGEIRIAVVQLVYFGRFRIWSRTVSSRVAIA